MPKFLYFGPDGGVSKHLQSLGWTEARHAEETDAFLIETYDNGDVEHLKRLEGTVAVMRLALNHIVAGRNQWFIALTDYTSENGNPREAVLNRRTVDARPNGVHGFGTLTVEVLGRLATKNGAVCRIVKHKRETTVGKIEAFLHSMENTDPTETYDVLRMDV